MRKDFTFARSTRKSIVAIFALAATTALAVFSGCSFASGSDGKSYDIEITRVSLSRTTLSINQGESEYIKLSLSPSGHQGKVNVQWEYDKELLDCKTDNFGVVVTGKAAGGTYIKAKCNGIVSTCLVSVLSSGDDGENPYIYSSDAVLEMKNGDSRNVSVSLYGGSVAAMEDFQWEIKDPTIARIDCARNNCVVTAIKNGSTQLVATHPDAAYSYSFVVYVTQDLFATTYITTKQNVLTINKNEEDSKTIKVDLVNPVSAGYQNGFKWDYYDDESKGIVSLVANMDTAEVVPKKNGVAKLVVTHENAEWPLEIIVRVNTIVKNTYIAVSTPTLVVTGSDDAFTVYATVENYDGYANPDGFKWTVPSDADAICDWEAVGNSFRVVGKKNGVFKVSVGHELSTYSRNVLVILQEQIGSAADASMYITSDDNYVQTKVGAGDSTINIRLVGGDSGDENDFIWKVGNVETTGGEIYVNDKIAKVQYVSGKVETLARSAVSSGKSCSGKLIISPLDTGVLNISVGHPRCLYDLEITVRIYSKYALLEDPVTITTKDSLVKLLNGSSIEVTAELANAATGDENAIAWSSADETTVQVAPKTGEITQISAVGSGSHQTYVSAHLDKAIADRKILVLSADTQDDLNNMKAIWCDSSYVRLSEKTKKTVSVESIGLDVSSDRISWTTSDPSVCVVSGISSSRCVSEAELEGIKEGECTVTASVSGGEPVVLKVTVVPEGESPDVIEAPKYLTTRLNAVVIEDIGKSETLSVSGVNISSEDMQLYTNWAMNDTDGGTEGVFDLAGSPGPTVTLTAKSKGKSTISVSNKMSSNAVKINAKCGELYEWTDGYVVYITSESDVYNIVNGQTKTIACSLANTTSTGVFDWKVKQDEEVIAITGLASGTCSIETKQAGQARIIVTNTLATVNGEKLEYEILVNVANSEAELSGFRYLTTASNVVTVAQGSRTTVSVEIANMSEVALTGYDWQALNPAGTEVVSVVSSGNVATIYGNKCGTVKVKVSNLPNKCEHALEIIVNVVDPIAAALDPYIAVNSILTCTVGGDRGTVLADLVGGTEADYSEFRWTAIDPSMISLYASAEKAEIKALKEGITQVIVHHDKASVDRTILVICEPKFVANCHISLTESIIKMSPTESARTITAELINGESGDEYDFKWWADSYDKINMNYTGASCLVEPIASGTATIHVSHPKAANAKDIVLYISNYTDFAFSENHITVMTGSDSFVGMEVPATGVNCEVSYSSSDPSICTAFGNSSVCTLSPKSLPDKVDQKTCTITATLLTKGGQVQARAECLVLVQRKDETKPYLAIEGSTIITMNKGEKRNVTALLYGNVADTSGAGIKWEISEQNGTVATFTSQTLKGKTSQIMAVSSGKTIMTLTHPECASPLTVYIIVAGTNEPTVTLNYSELPVYIGEATNTITATVVNDTGEELQWTVEPSNQNFFAFTAQGTKASVYAKEEGEAKVVCTIPSTGGKAECKVLIRKSPEIKYFIYVDEDDPSKGKLYPTTLQLYPGKSKMLHYETIPEKDSITKWYVSDSSRYKFTDKGYGATVEGANGKARSYDDNVGTVELLGKTTQGSAVLQVTSNGHQQASISIANSYNYLFTTDKSSISLTPAKLIETLKLGEESPLHIKYEVRPANAKIFIKLNARNGNAECSQYLKIENEHSVENDATGKSFVIERHDSVDPVTDIASGIIRFKLDNGAGKVAETNCTAIINAYNYDLVSSGTNSKTREEIGRKTVDFKVFYQTYSFDIELLKMLPYINHGVFGTEDFVTKYSKIDTATKSLIIGDGEYIESKVSVKEEGARVKINGIYFVADEQNSVLDGTTDNKTQYQYLPEGTTGIKKAGDYNSATFHLSHSKDYGHYRYNNGNALVWNFDEKGNSGDDAVVAKNWFYRMTTATDWRLENMSDVLKASPYVGYVEIAYFSIARAKEATYKIPVYVEVRNNPCAQHTLYY